MKLPAFGLGLFLLVCGALPGQAAGRPEVLGSFEQVYPQTLKLLQADFPADYEDLVAFIDGLDPERYDAAAGLTAASVKLTEIKRKLAFRIPYAPDEALQRVMVFLTEFHKLVDERAGPEACTDFAANGTGALFDRGIWQQFSVELDVQSLAFLTAVREAIANPSYHGTIRKGDFDAIGAALLAHGGSVEDLSRIAKNDPKDPKLCGSIAAFFGVVALLDTPQGERARADFARNAGGY